LKKYWLFHSIWLLSLRVSLWCMIILSMLLVCN